MKAVEIKKDIYWVGAIDWDLRNFHGYLTQRGSTYNSYLIIDDKITLVDTVKEYLFDEMVERITDVIDPAKIDYIVSNHVEMDHSGGLPELMKLCPNAVVITSPNGEKGLKKHYAADWGMKVIDAGSSVSIGKRTLEFVLTPMVHWPDSMVTYIPEEKLLLSNDSFGQHIASSERFDDELGLAIAVEEAKKYYANIVLPYGRQVQTALDTVAKLDIDMIAPSHGLIWRGYLKEIIGLYDKWSSNTCKEKAAIIYGTMWGSTEKIASAVKDVFEEKGIPVSFLNMKNSHISDIMTQIMESKYICVGSSTLNNGMLPDVAGFLSYFKGLAPKDRVGFAFGSYGWGGQSVKQVEEVLAGCGFKMIESVKVQYIPTCEDINKIKEKVREGLG